ncbi:MAG: DUF4349 domain-containing protein [Chloroflexi bacterium]|nr:DUF4349 domain-containing protein [Chloroflexota bacterium]
MNSNDTPEQELERALQAHYEAEAERLRAPDDLWQGIAGRLEGPLGPGEQTPGWRRVFTPRQLGLASALAMVTVVLFALSGAWFLFPGGPGQSRTAIVVSKEALPGATAAPAPTRAPAASAPTATPAPMASATNRFLFSSDDEILQRGSRGAAGPAGPAGEAGDFGPDTGLFRPRAAENQGRDAWEVVVLQDSAAGAATAPPAPAVSPDEDSASRDPAAGDQDLQAAQRQVISQASVSVEVEEVPAAVAQVRAIAEGLGGFVEQLSSSGGPERQRSTMTIRVPQPDFFTALERIKSLGKVHSENLGSEDVTEQFIDLAARLRSALRQEESLLSLLERAGQVSEILTIERELSRVRADIERDQGRLNFLERRVDLATINVTLSPPSLETGDSPSASLTVSAPDVRASVEAVKGLVSNLGGVMDRVLLTGGGSGQAADLSLRVFAADFSQALAAIEREGDVLDREVREGSNPSRNEASTPEEPDARINLSIRRRDAPEPPSASLTVVVPDVMGSVNALKQRVSTLGGVIDQSTITVRGERDSAFLSLRVFRTDFDSVLASVEGLGDLRNKVLKQGMTALGGAEAGAQGPGSEPGSRIEVDFVEDGGSSNTGLILAVIGASAGGLTLVALLGFLFFAVYRAGRRGVQA